jgi:hypothetical protein
MGGGYSGLYSDTGGNSGKSSSTNKLPEGRAQLMHIFRKKEGHLVNTRKNRDKILAVANTKKYYLGTDAKGKRWYVKTNKNGSQTWASCLNGVIIEGGYNRSPILWDEITGLNKNPFKKGGKK